MTPETMTWLEHQKPGLVKLAEDFVQETKLEVQSVSPSQLRNLLSAAQSGSSLALLVNFLRYQIGRGSRGWKHQPSGLKLEKLLGGKLLKLSEQGSKACGHTEKDVATYELQALLAAQFFGFLIRDFTYRSAVAQEDRP